MAVAPITELAVRDQMAEQQREAWKSLARYKFLMFGYHVAAWVILNKLLPPTRRSANPFGELVRMAKAHIAPRKEA